MYPTVKSQIINLEDWVEVASALMREHLYVELPDFPTEKVDDAWNYRVAQRWVGLYLNDEFNARMKWSKVSSDAEDYAIDQLLLGLTDGEENVNLRKMKRWLHDNLYEALDPVVILITEAVHEIVAPNPWWVWLPHINRGIAVMESVEDYRIRVFHEKLDAGEWTA